MKPKLPDQKRTPTADSKPESTLWDRMAFALLGGLKGAIYGVVMLSLVFMLTRQAHIGLIPSTAIIFAGLGFFFGNVIAEALLSILYFLWGLLGMLSEIGGAPPAQGVSKHLHSFFWLGVGTGLSLLVFYYS